MTFSFMGGYSIFYGAVYSIRWYIFYYGKFVLIAFFIMFAYSYYNKDLILSKNRKWMLRMFLIPVIIMFLYSVIIWISNKTAFPYITRGCSDSIFQAWAYIGGICFAFVYKKDAIKYGLYSALITYSMGILLGICVTLGKMVGVDIYGTNYTVNMFLELHEVVYVIGLYIIFLIFINRRKYIKAPMVLLMISIVYFVLGGKRIGIAAVVLVCIYGAFLVNRNRWAKSKLLKITGWICLFICTIYVALTVSDKLSQILNSLGIDMMGRNIIYNYFRRFCSFSPSYLGRGVGFVSRQFDYTTAGDLLNMVSVKALHNDFMKIYINIGFVGFLIWCWYWVRRIPQSIEKKVDTDSAFFCLLIILFAFITYATDNTEGYSNFQMHMCMMISTICYMGLLNRQEERI